MSKSIIRIGILFFALIAYTACSKDSDKIAQITINEGPNGDFGGDFTGNGGDRIQTFAWENALSTADYNADITATAAGLFTMTIKDADGNTVFVGNLDGAVEPDSFSGVTNQGTPGTWTVTITLTDFNGDGSFSLSEGN